MLAVEVNFKYSFEHLYLFHIGFFHRRHPKLCHRSLRHKFKTHIVKQRAFKRKIFPQLFIVFESYNCIACVRLFYILSSKSVKYISFRLCSRLSSYLAIKSYSEVYYTLFCTPFANVTLAAIQHYPDVFRPDSRQCAFQLTM